MSKSFCLLAVLICTLSSCYPMPTEDEYSLIPTVNNPNVTREKGGGFNPSSVSY